MSRLLIAPQSAIRSSQSEMTMRLSDLLSENLILTSLEGTDVPSVLSEFAHAICEAGRYGEPETIYGKLLDRERQESTGIGKGVAIPHCKVEDLPEVILAVGYSDKGVDFHSIDGQPAYFFFVVISPASSSVLHLRVLAALSRLLRSQSFHAGLLARPAKKELIELMKREEEGAAVAP